MIVSKDDEALSALHQNLRVCFSCAKPLEDVHKVEWHGAGPDGTTVQFALHAGCAGNLALHLAKDALEADLRNGRRLFDHGPKFPR
jgi:hypothetical protein